MNVRNLIQHKDHIEIHYTEKDSVVTQVMKLNKEKALENKIDLFDDDLRAHHIQYLISKNLLHLIS